MPDIDLTRGICATCRGVRKGQKIQVFVREDAVPPCAAIAGILMVQGRRCQITTEMRTKVR